MGPVELLDPKGLWLLTGLVPLVLFYVLKVKRKRVPVGSTWLWAAARRDLLAKHPFKKLVAELPLILQILALVILAIAFARPAMRGAQPAGDHLAIVVDTSASMGTAMHTGGTRMDAAKRAVAGLVAGLRPGADAILIEAARDARVAAPLEHDARHLAAAAAALDVRDVEGDLAGAVALAADRLRSLGGKRRIVLVTDLALAHDTPLAAAGIDTDVVAVGDEEDNAGIVRVDMREGVDPATKHEQAQLFALVENFAARPRDAFVTLTVQGEKDPIGSRRVLLPAKSKTPVVLSFEPQATDRGRGLVVQLSPGDALPIDDVAYARVPEGLRLPVTLASPAPYSWLARALEADRDIDFSHVTLDQLKTVNVEPGAMVAVEGACPDPLPGLDAIVVAPPTGTCFGVGVGAPVANPPITSWETADPRLRFLTLDGVHVARSAGLEVEGAHGALVRSSRTTLVADASLPGRTITLVGFDVGESDWPLQASFVLFVRNVVELARIHRAQGAAGPARTGEPLEVAVPAGTTKVRVQEPGGVSLDVPVKGGFAVVPPLQRAGLYDVGWTDPHVGGVLLAVNLTSEAESDVTPKPARLGGEGGAGADAAVSKLEPLHAEWGTWLALAAALLVALDVWWITRRPRRRVATGTG